MTEYIEKQKAIKLLDMCKVAAEKRWKEATNPLTKIEFKADKDTIEAMIEVVASVEATDVQPVDAKEILRHLDSLMICVGNAYNTSHYLLESDMVFIEKQEKIIKGLLSNKPIKG